MGNGRAQGMRVEQITSEGVYEKGRLVGISGHWEDGAALMWNTEMLRLGLIPYDDAQWNKLSDSSGIRLRGTQKSMIGGIWMKWKKPIDNTGLDETKKEKGAPGQASDTPKTLRGMIVDFVSAAGQAAKNHVIAELTAAAEARLKQVDEVVVCASCPNIYQDEVSDVCRNLGIQKAYGRAGDMLDSLSGNEWLGKWEAKVVMATVTMANTLKAQKARIICISGGTHCDLEMAQQPKIVRAIKQEMVNDEFIVKVEWIDIRQFREDYAAGYSGVSFTLEGSSKPSKHTGNDDLKFRPASAETGDVKRNHLKGKQADHSLGGAGRAGGKQVGDDATARPAIADGRSKMAAGTADCRPARSSKRSGADVGKDRGPGKGWVCKQCGKQFPAQHALVQHQSGTGHAGITRGAPGTGKPPKDGHTSAVWVCGECERQFASEAACDQHQTATGHSDPTCWCGRAFGSRGALQQHMDATGHDPMSSSEHSDEEFF
jgi:hypothetical protein